MSHSVMPSHRLISHTVATVAALGLAAAALAPAASAQNAVQSQNDVAPAGAEVQRTSVAPTLTDLVTLDADKSIQPGPASGAKVPGGPFPGQILPGFGGLVANGDGTFYGLPDNGFVEKDKSADHLLRIYKIKPTWFSAAGADEKFDVIKTIQLTDPDGHMPGTIVNDGTADRKLTGGDLNPGAIQRAKDGTWWIAEEYGPWIMHFSKDGKLLEEPIGVQTFAPENPAWGNNETHQKVPSNGGFTALARSKDGLTLYAVLEKAEKDRDQSERLIFEIDTIGWEEEGPEWSTRYWKYKVDDVNNSVTDAQLDQNGRLLIMESDNKAGAQAQTKRIYSVELDDTANAFNPLPKRLEVDLLKLRNPNGIGEYGGIGQGNPYSFVAKDPAAMVVLKNGDIVVANDNNYPNDSAIFNGQKKDPITMLKIARKLAQ